MKKIKYIYKGKEALHAKLVFGEMTLADVIEVVCHPGYMIAYKVQIQLFDDEAPSAMESPFQEQRFKVAGEEFHTLKVMFGRWQEYDGPIALWFRLDEKVRVLGDVIEIRPLKGTRKKMARLQFLTCKGAIDIFERTKPIPEKTAAGR